MSVKFLDVDHRLPTDRRRELEMGVGALMNAEYKEAYGILESCAGSDDDLTRGFAFHYLGDLYHVQWEFKLCMQSYEKARELFEQVGHERGRIMTMMRIADIYIDDADTSAPDADEALLEARSRARDVLETAISDAKALNDQFLVGFGYHYRALFLIEAEDYAQAREEATEAVRIRESIGDEVYCPSSMTLLARSMAELGDFAEAKGLAERAFQLQMDRNVRGSALRTLWNISHIGDLETMSRNKELTSQFTAVEPIARTPYLVDGHAKEEFSVMAHAVAGPTPLMATNDAAMAMRGGLVSERAARVMFLYS
ncbi:MAG TPA: tetratricopeptide repeat protein [Streptosporangiaceae bacterium]|jgi:tetratricopeptide (TPR) repeat protein